MLKEKLQEDLKTALKARQTTQISTLRLALSEIKNKEIEKKGALEDAEVTALLANSVKRRKESIAQFEQGNRPDLAEQEKSELAVIAGYLPKPLSAGEIEQLVRAAVAKLGAAGPQDFGRVMKEVMAQSAGRAGGKEVTEIVKKLLNNN